jgi:hypothetical protein
MESDPIIEELWRIKEEIWAEAGHDIRRLVEDSRRRQYLRGRDLYGRSEVTGRIEVVWRAPRAAEGARGVPTDGCGGSDAAPDAAVKAGAIADAAAAAVAEADVPPSPARP